MLQVHRRLGDFEIIRLLGKGGMGEVYEAQQLNPPRRVALKVLSPWLSENEEALKRFWREAAVPAQLDHPGIVRIISTGKTEDGFAFYTMHLVRGLSLTQIMRGGLATAEPPGGGVATTSEALTIQETPRSTGPAPGLPPEEPEALPALREYREDRFGLVVRVGIQAARALAAAHRQGVLHRDIKPSNLMIDRHGQLYLVDFGLTKGLVPDALVTRTGVVCGTPWYMSPEQARCELIDARSDLYSLGITLYELVTGGAGPFTASRDDTEAVLEQVKSGQVRPLHTLAPGVPPALERIIARAMDPKPQRRYQRAEDLAEDLEALLRTSPNGPPSLQTRSLFRLPAARRSVFGGVFALLGVLLLTWLLGPMGQWLSPGRPPNGPPTGDSTKADDRLLVADLPPLPAPLRERMVQVRQPLLRNDFEPIWSHRLHGEGHYHRMVNGLVVNSLPVQGWTLLALDNDPQQRWFEFAIEMAQVREEGRNTREGGLFFGWRRNPEDPEKRYRFFVLRLQEPPKDVVGSGKLLLGSAYIDEERGARQELIEPFRPLPPEQREMTLPPVKPDGWRRVQVRAVDHLVKVTVDNVTLEFDVRAVQPIGGQGPNTLDARGALGIWARNGQATFREVFVTALPSEGRGNR
jgi:serine/threonine protein kinase